MSKCDRLRYADLVRWVVAFAGAERGGYATAGGAGGGGSGYVDPSASQNTLTTGKGAAVANGSDGDYVLDAGVGGSAGAWDCPQNTCTQVAPSAGGNGRVVVRLPKP